MRIAIVAPLVTAIREPQLGGSQALVADLAVGLQTRGHEVHVYAASGSAIPGVTVIDTGVDASSLAGLLYRHGGSPASDARAARFRRFTFTQIWEGIARHGRPIQYSHITRLLTLWDVWTPIAGPPVAFEPLRRLCP